MLAIALVHYPTLNKQGKVVTTSVTNFDIHDIARAARTYGVERYFIVTPVELQRQFTRRIIAHWLEGSGAEYNPTRKDALAGVGVVADLAAAGQALERDFGCQPSWVATSARRYPNAMSCAALRKIAPGRARLPDFRHGLRPASANHRGSRRCPGTHRSPAPFNHLSVRSAVSIYLDRLLGIK